MDLSLNVLKLQARERGRQIFSSREEKVVDNNDEIVVVFQVINSPEKARVFQLEKTESVSVTSSHTNYVHLIGVERRDVDDLNYVL